MESGRAKTVSGGSLQGTSDRDFFPAAEVTDLRERRVYMGFQVWKLE